MVLPLRRMLGCAGLALVLGPLAAAELPYDEKADAGAEVAQAIASARAAHRDVLLVFGANWCKDCRMLDTELKQGRLAKLIAERYVVVKVDVGNFDKNLDLAQRYDNPIKKGIPSIAVLDAAGSPVFVTRAGELASARSMGEPAIYDFFAKVPRPG